MASQIDQLKAFIPATVSSEDLLKINNIIVGTALNDTLLSTGLNDLVIALGGDDVITGSVGHDILIGGTGSDTVDYSALGQAVTLLATGIVDKGKAGIDQLFEIETIIGAKGQANTIDASTSTGTTTSIDVNLSSNTLLVNGVPGVGTLKFAVQNFVNVIGTSQNDIIVGDRNNNLLIGGLGNDQILGLDGNDNVQGGAGDDVIGGGNKSSSVISRLTDGNDIVQGEAGNDTLIAGTGNDLLDGGTGLDTADYSGLGVAIALEAGGIVNKGRAGIDQILNIETIIGAAGQANTINGATGTSTTTSFNVNLSANSLIVNGVPGLGTLSFNVQNFLNVTGTSQSDSIIGNNLNNLLIGGLGNDQILGLSGNDTVQGGAGDDVLGGGSRAVPFISRLTDGNDIVQGEAGNDTLIAGTGNDLLDGGTGLDTADYSNVGVAIALEAGGVVNKGGAGVDQILNIETIIGTVGQANTINGATGTSTTTSFQVDLSVNSLVVNGVPGLGTLSFNVQNFVNVTGTSQNDNIIGNNLNNLLIGGRGSDQISGLGGKDTIIGVDPTSFQPGIKEVDTLSGGADPDRFILGDGKNPYYVGGGGFLGLNDFALITDFQTTQDQLQLKKLDNYIFGRNFIAIANPLQLDASKDFDSSVIDATVNEIIKTKGIYDASKTSSLESSGIFSGIDIISIVSTGYSVNDIQFV